MVDARLPDGRLLFTGHVVHPHVSGNPRREVLVSQITREGKLESAEVTLRLGETVVTHEGLWTAGTWRMQQRMGLESLGVKSTPNRPLLVDAGSVTTYLLLGQAPLAARFPVISLHEALEPEEAFWNVELDDEGQHQIRTHVGRLAFRLDERGGIERALVVAGAGVIEVDGMESESFGGPGLLLSLEKRRAIRELRAALPPADASTGEESTTAGEDEVGEG